MSPYVAILHLHPDASRADEAIALRPRMVAALKAVRPGLESMELVRVDDTTWLDIVHWRSKEEFSYQEAAQRGRESEDFRAWAEIVQVAGLELGEVLV
ncbi:MAG: hypothetical protein ACRDVP_06340 [Acidimicrobiales bacterium]